MIGQKNNIRNFAIIAHIDHGKSTLAVRFLELTNPNKKFESVLESIPLEQEKGITIKLNAIQLGFFSTEKNLDYQLNLIDTPGHVDFVYEVSRSLAACEGVILLVDATKGIQAQTLAYYQIAKELKLKVIPAINKVDLPTSERGRVIKQIKNLLGCAEEEINLISAKTGENVELLLRQVIEKIPGPKLKDGKLKALVFDLSYNKYQGVVVYIKVVQGEIFKGQKIKVHKNSKIYQVEKVGIKKPEEVIKEKLVNGEIGWFAANIREMEEVKVGNTIFELNYEGEPLEGYQEIKPNIYCNIFPEENEKYHELKKSLEELKLQDGSVSLENIDSQLLGPGLRCGFLGLLHQEIICERLEKEFKQKIILTPPSVDYKVTYQDGRVIKTNNPQKISSEERIKKIEEIFIELNIFTPEQYIGEINRICQEKRGIFQKSELTTEKFFFITYEMPFSEFILDFHDQMKSVSQGYASFNYRIIGFAASEVVKVDIMLNGEIIGDLAFLVHKEKAYQRASINCEMLKKTLNPQNFAIPIQATVGRKIIARETVPALKKNVTGNLYGGDRTRKMKLWAKQKKGKKRMKELGKVNFSSFSFKEILKKKSS